MGNMDNKAALLGAQLSRRRILGGLTGLAALGTLAACGGSDTSTGGSGSTGTGAKGGTMVIDVKTEPTGYNPLAFANSHVRWMAGQIIDPLYEYDDDNNIIDNLAVGAPETTDGITWTIKLKAGVKFHNGDEFTAEDAAASFLALATPPTVAFSSQVGTVKSAVATDPTTLTLVLSEPNYVLPAVLATYPMLHRDHVQDMTDIIGTGPFVWGKLAPASELSLTANKDYHLGAPLLDGLTFRFVPDPNTRVVDVLQKKSNVSMVPAFSTLPKVEDASGVSLIDVEAAVMLPIHVNTTSEVFKDVRVRQALAFAMDRTRVRDVVFAGKAEILRSGVIPPTLRGYDETNDFYPETADVDKAKALLAEAGVTTPVKFTAAVYNVPESAAAMQVIQQDWAAAGFEMEIQTLDLASWVQILISKDFDMCVSYEYNGTWWGLDGINQLSNYGSDAATNWVNYSDPAFDELLSKSRASQDADEQTEIWKQMNGILTEAAVNLLPAVPHLTAATLSAVDGINLAALGRSALDLRKATIA